MVREVTGKDIADLLLLCAPKEALEQIELSEENKTEFSDCFSELPTLVQSEITALALYYSNRSTAKYLRSVDLVRKIYISPEVIHSLIQLTQVEEYSESDNIFNKMETLRRSNIAKKAANAKHNKEGGSRDKAEQIRMLWATGKYSSRDICAEQECAALDMSYSAARKALINTPNPTK